VASALCFFLILTALMVLRPAREALGMQRGIEAVRWLFVGTAVVTLAVNPVFALLVSRYRRQVFITVTYLFFAVSLLGFYAVLVTAPQAIGEVSGMVFFVWFSVFNLFVTMVFWALMADRFALEQSKRLFGVISVATVGEGAVTVLWIIFFRDVLGSGAQEFGYFIAAYGVGGILGGILLGWSSRLIDETRLCALSLIANGLLLIAIFNTRLLPVIVALAVLAGVTVVGWFVTSQTLLQK
jgi:ATP/ADP translocase